VVGMTNKRTVTVDKYARNVEAWKRSAHIAYTASSLLFESRNLLLIFPAATLGHHALEMYLKAALISEGCTVFDPKKIRRLDSSVVLQTADCAWGHDLVVLARQLAERRPDFDLAEPMTFLLPLHSGVPTLERGFEVFNPFFSELRYPQGLKELGGVGEDDKLTLDELVASLHPFLAKIK
jgi:hypothetical protein